MAFIITLIALVIERFFHWTHLRHWRWLTEYERLLSGRFGKGPSYLTFLIYLLPPLVIVGLVEYLLSGWWYGGLRLIFGVAVLLYCLGPSNLWLQVYKCLSELHKEEGYAAKEQIQTAFDMPSSENNQAFHHRFTRAIFIAAYHRIFAVLFWFVILGPIGAVLYRLTALCREQSVLEVTGLARVLQQLLDWVPVRLFTFIFALGGHFTEVFARWREYVSTGLGENEKLLSECGMASLEVVAGSVLPEDGTAEKRALALLDRVFIMGLVALAVIVLIT